MESVKVKIENYDRESNSLIVSFSCLHEGKHYETTPYSFNSVNFNADTEEELVKLLALIGSDYLDQKIKSDKLSHDFFESISNKEYNLNMSDVRPVHSIHTADELKLGDSLEVEI
jgi:hypothetical protein